MKLLIALIFLLLAGCVSGNIKVQEGDKICTGSYISVMRDVDLARISGCGAEGSSSGAGVSLTPEQLQGLKMFIGPMIP